MADSIHEQIENDRARSLPEASLLKTFRAYTRGRQRATLTAGQERILRGLLGNLFCDNICKQVVQAPANRLQLARFDVSVTGVLDYLKDVWTLNKLTALASAVHWATFRDGNHAVGLAWDNGRVRLSREPWWNGETGMFVAYDDMDQPTYAVKEWKEGDKLRRTVYRGNQIERYISDADGWKPFRLPEDGDIWPVPWKLGDQPLGIPVVHFANYLIPNDGDGGLADPDSHYGMSELDGGILGLQDEINDLHRDISAAARFTGYQMLWGTGITPQKDENGNDIPLRVEPGAFISDMSETARFGTFPPGSLAELERTLNLKLRAVSRVADVPMHLIGGEWPSGEALLRAEMGLIEKVGKAGQSIGPAWASVAHKACRISNAFGGTVFDDNAMITAVFAPPSQHDPLTMALIAEKRAPYVSEEEVLRLLGYQPDAIVRILDEKAANRERNTAFFEQAMNRA